MRAYVLALVAAGCLAAPPDPADPDGGGADGGDGDHARPGDGADGGAHGCVAGSVLDLVWVSEVSFDQLAQDQVSLRGMALVVNPGTDPIDLGSLSVVPSVDGGAVAAEYSLSGDALSLPAGEVMGALNTAAAIALEQFDENWTNLDAPELDVVLHFDGSGVDSEVPLQLDIGGYTFDLSILVGHDPLASGLDWVRRARRISAVCQ